MYGDEERTRTITYTGIFIALFAVGGYITIPMIPVPFTLQTLFVILSGAVMRKKAVIPVLLYIVLGNQFTAGPGVLLGPTGGYRIGFIFAALIVGYLYGSPEQVRQGGMLLRRIRNNSQANIFRIKKGSFHSKTDAGVPDAAILPSSMYTA